jgi:hypothetical protein
MWLDNEREQLTLGHHCHRDQCEQLEPSPHAEFIYASCCLMWREALKQGDRELASACEADMGRSIALWKRLNLGGIVCAPSARAKDPDDKSNDAGVGQWRNRPADAILVRVVGGKRIKFEGLSVQLFDECIALIARKASESVFSLRVAPLPKLRVPIHRVSLGPGPSAGYAAWHEPTEENRRALGKDALSGVVHRVKGRPELHYDWNIMPREVTEGSGKVEVIGAGS